MGGLSTRAWANPLRHLRAGGRPVIDQPRSIVPIGLDEALRREHRASQLPEVRSLVGELISAGYKRSGEPKGADGVAGYVTEGGHAVSLAFAKDGSDEATAFVDVRWWDRRRDPWPCEERMPDVYSKEVIHGVPGTPSVIRFRYVDERDGLASREETFEAGSVADVECEPDCHPHPPGACPPECDGSGPHLCLHCDVYENVCSGPPPDCPQCLACLLCVHWACGALCTVTCGAICNSFSEKYCCDERTYTCCPPDFSTFPPTVHCL